MSVLTSLIHFIMSIDEQVSSSPVVVQYLAVVQGGSELIGSQGQLGPLTEVHSLAHVVKMLKIEDWHFGKTKNFLN